jgi:probable addiction module antidote protein
VARLWRTEKHSEEGYQNGKGLLAGLPMEARKMKTRSYHEDLISDLKDPEFALEYLNACLKGGDEGTFLLGLRYVAEAHGGVRMLARKTHLSREHLFKMLSKNGNPRFESLKLLADAFGWRLAFVHKNQQPMPRAA